MAGAAPNQRILEGEGPRLFILYVTVGAPTRQRRDLRHAVAWGAKKIRKTTLEISYE